MYLITLYVLVVLHTGNACRAVWEPVMELRDRATCEVFKDIFKQDHPEKSYYCTDALRNA